MFVIPLLGIAASVTAGISTSTAIGGAVVGAAAVGTAAYCCHDSDGSGDKSSSRSGSDGSWDFSNSRLSEF